MAPLRAQAGPGGAAQPRGECIRDHWRDHVYGLAQNHGVEIHVPPTSPAPRSPWRSTPSPKNEDAAERTARRLTTPSSSRGRIWGDEGVLHEGAKTAGLNQEAAVEAA